MPNNQYYDQVMAAQRNRGAPGGNPTMPSWLQPIMQTMAKTGAPQAPAPQSYWQNGVSQDNQNAMDAGAAKQNQRWMDAYNRGAPGVQGKTGPTALQAAGGATRGMTKMDQGMQMSLNTANMRPGAGMGGGAFGGVGGPGVAGGGVGGAGGAGNVGGELSKYMDQANAANEQRYAQLLSLSGQMSNSAQDRETQLRNNQLGESKQRLQSRGLGNSTIVDSVANQINDQSGIRQREIGDAGMLNAQGIIERRTDQGPDYGLIASLAARPGAAGGGIGPGTGFGGGGGAVMPAMAGGASPGRKLFGSGLGQSLANISGANNGSGGLNAPSADWQAGQMTSGSGSDQMVDAWMRAMGYI